MRLFWHKGKLLTRDDTRNLECLEAIGGVRVRLRKELRGMAHRISQERRWWQSSVVCCLRCGSVDVRYRKTDKLYICNRCGRQSGDVVLSIPENRPFIRRLRAAWRGMEQGSRVL